MKVFEDELAESLLLAEKNDLKRDLRVLERFGKNVKWHGKTYLNLSSNDYLGIANDAELQKDFLTRHANGFNLSRDALSSSSSRLLTGHGTAYENLETIIADWYDKEAALVFNSGYHANVGLLSALAGPKCAVYFDKLNHASMIDGLKLSSAPYFRYKHNDMNHLETLLKKNRDKFPYALIVSESVFSMDGDLADVSTLVAIKKRYNATLLIDEAHGVGVFGNKGRGLSETKGMLEDVDVLMGTFGKALGGMGAFVATSKTVRDYLINNARSFIFSTALPPLQIEWATEIVKKVSLMKKEREHLHIISDTLRNSLIDNGLSVRGNSQIVPVILGENKKAVLAAKYLRENGFLVFPIRPPTVPPNTSRLRLSLTADMDMQEIKTLSDLLPEIVGKAV